MANILTPQSYIVIDTELTHRRSVGGIISIGAVSLSHPDAEPFYIECQVHPEAKIEEASEIDKGALFYAGFTKEQITDPRKPTAAQAVQALFKWSEQFEKGRVFLLGNLDQIMIELEAYRGNISLPSGIYYTRSYHTTALDYAEKNGIQIPLKDNGTISIGINAIGEMVGVKILRGEQHNSLEDACYTAEIMNRMLTKKSLYGEDYQSVINGIKSNSKEVLDLSKRYIV